MWHFRAFISSTARFLQLWENSLAAAACRVRGVRRIGERAKITSLRKHNKCNNVTPPCTPFFIKRGLSRHAVSVRLSVTFVDCVKTNKYVFNFFSSSGSQVILVFPCKTAWQYSDGNPPNGGVECRWGRHKSRSPWYSWLSIDDVLDLSTTSATIHRAVYHTYGDVSVNLYLSEPAACWLRQRVKNRTLYAVVNLKRNLSSMYCTIEANNRHEASRSLLQQQGFVFIFLEKTCFNVRFCLKTSIILTWSKEP